MRPANITRWRAYSLKKCLLFRIRTWNCYKNGVFLLHVFPRTGEVWGTENATFLLLDLSYQIHAWATEQKACVCFWMCVFSRAHTEAVSGCAFRVSSEPSGVDVFLFFSFLPQHCLDCQSQLSNTSPSERQAEFTLSQSAPRCVRMCRCVLTCARVLARGGGWWSSIHSNCQPSLSQIPHMSCYLSEKDGRQPPRFPTTLHPEVNFIREELQMCCSE